MALVAHHPKEETVEFSSLYRTMWRYAHHGIYAKFGVALDAFLELPRDYVEMLFRIATDETVIRNKEVSDVMKSIEQAGVQT